MGSIALIYDPSEESHLTHTNIALVLLALLSAFACTQFCSLSVQTFLEVITDWLM